MKIIVAITPVNYESLLIDRDLQINGHETRVFFMEDFSLVCSYKEKKLDELGIHSARNRYNSAKFLELTHLIETFAPDIVLFVDLITTMISRENLEEICRLCHSKNCRVIEFFVDPVKQYPDVESYLKLFDRIFSYDMGDVERLGKIAAIDYIPVGYGIDYERVDVNHNRSIDLSFVGTPWKERLRFFEPLARFIEERGKIFQFYGSIASSRYFWKKKIVSIKFPHVSKCIVNRRVTPSEAAEIYSNSKICLNLHSHDANSPNPRTFDILATGSFQLMDERAHYAGLIPSEDLVTYNSVGDLISKVEYFLQHEDERLEIARNGWKKVVPRFRLANCLEEILS